MPCCTQLLPRERAALARGYLRFTVDRPVIVDVAAPVGSIPFWVSDQGFETTGIVLKNPDAAWRVYRKHFPSGTVGLGVNGLDRTPPAHYVVFVRRTPPGEPANAQPSVSLETRSAGSWKISRADPGASAARDCHKPFESIPPDLAGAILLQPSHDERHSVLLATGRVWKTRVVAGDQPTQVAIAFGGDPARELVWTWTTSPERKESWLRLAREPACSSDRSQPDQSPVKPESIRLVRGESTAVDDSQPAQ